MIMHKRVKSQESRTVGTGRPGFEVLFVLVKVVWSVPKQLPMLLAGAAPSSPVSFLHIRSHLRSQIKY